MTTTPLVFSRVSAGSAHSCGITTDDQAYCWGLNTYGAVGDGTTFDRWTPVLVAGGLRFRQISAGTYNTCGVTLEHLAYCWGSGEWGDLGNGATNTRLTPFPVTGGLQFRRVDTNYYYTCGVSYPDNRVYCWGKNLEGQLGIGTTETHYAPVAIVGTLRFRQVSAGGFHTCGVTTDDRAFCWGLNRSGQLGDSSEVRRRLKPALVAGGHQFSQVDAGEEHTCGVTTEHRAYCWGNGRNGQIGNGKTYLSFWPRRVVSGHSFDHVTAGAHHTCGETTLDRAYCWGSNDQAQLGDGTVGIDRLTPVAVIGGLFLNEVQAGGFHTCGKSSTGLAYCWGYNSAGQLGDGTTIQRSSPVPVAGAM